MDFSKALEQLKSGDHMRRSGWATAGASIHLMHFTSAPGQPAHLAPCIVWDVPGRTPQPGWLCSIGDMLANDWEFANPDT